AFMPDGRMLLTGCDRSMKEPASAPAAPKKPEVAEKSGGVARLWVLADGRSTWQVFFSNPVTFVGVSPDPAGRLIVAGGFEIRVWERVVDEDKKFRLVPIGTPFQNPEPGQWGVFSPDPDEQGTLLLIRPSGHADIHHLLQRGSTPERVSPQGWVAAAG